ncbi:MAG TPA: hypothetical protein VJN18_32475 [Polyangiaceae bacterium]|nr:hypothetical protein [Polyangiaceae bacterium]
MTALAKWALLALALSSCAAPVEPSEQVVPVVEAPTSAPAVDRLRSTWLVDERFTPEEVESILAAADAWRAVTRGRVDLAFTFGALPTPTPAWSIERAVIAGANGRATISADGGTWLVLDAETYVDSTCVGELWHVAAHEFGHALGIHSHEPGGVMSTGSASCNATFTAGDVELFNAANPSTVGIELSSKTDSQRRASAMLINSATETKVVLP